MKRYITSFVMMAMLAVSVPMLATTAEAQRSCRTRSSRSSESRRYSSSYNSDYYDNGYYNGGTSRVGRVYNRHRQAVNIAGGAAAGALLGALLGGKKGALIGAGVGAAAGVVVTKKQAPRNYTRYRY